MAKLMTGFIQNCKLILSMLKYEMMFTNHQKVVEIHRLSITKTRARAWMIFQSVPHLRRSVRGLEAYDV